MNKTRLEAFSDGVIAIIITILVLELKIPKGDTIDALAPMLPVFVAYVLSFVNLGIYWNNHHHMLQATRHINGSALWANLHLLFWLSLIPFSTAWMGENKFATVPTAIYGFVLLCCGIAYTILQKALVGRRVHENVELYSAVGRDTKGKASIALYIAAIPLAFLNRWAAFIIYILVAAMWFIPDRRIESRINRTSKAD